MPLRSQQIPVEIWGDNAPPWCAVRIKRQSDGFVYDAADKTFKAEPKVQSPWVNLAPSSSPTTPNVSETLVDIDPAQFTDGDYTIYFHDMSAPVKRLMSVSEVYVHDGTCATQRVPTVTETAGRVLDCTVASHKAVGTVGAWMLDVSARLQSIESKLNSLLQTKTNRST